MNIVQITTTIFDSTRLDKNAEAWLSTQIETKTDVENEDILQLRSGVILKRCDSSRVVEFGGGPTTKDGFSYQFSQHGNDVVMVYVGAEKDYGYGDIRQLIGDCQVCENVLVQQLTVQAKAWPK